jgi:ornithine cyclodeaminase
MKLITTTDLIRLVHAEGLPAFMHGTIGALEGTLNRWQAFHNSPRHVIDYPHGVMELMPCADDRFYACKYVNGHPGNTAHGRLSVVAIGLLAEVESGFPVMLSEMTLLTALRTAATSALAARYLARSDSKRLAIIGTGAQSEFQILALREGLPLREIRYFDRDAGAMTKFARNLAGQGLSLTACAGIDEALDGAEIIVTNTAARRRVRLFDSNRVRPGVHINALGGDSVGKTELDPELLERCKIVVEYLPQSRAEGEIQNRPEGRIHAELWELVQGKKPGRESDGEITLFDSVGFALEDFAILTFVHELSERHGIFHDVELIPSPADPKNLYGLLGSP